MNTKKTAKAPHISTELPGPKTKALMNRKMLTFLRPETPPTRGVAAKRTYGAIVEDLDGNIFLSFNPSINAVGYNHPKVVKAVQEQIVNISGGAGLSIPFVECAEKLKSMLPGGLNSGKVGYTATGSEAIDLMTRLARDYTKKKIIISFHGINFGEGTVDCSRLSGVGTHMFKGGLSPLITEVLYAPWPYCYRCPMGHTLDSCNFSCLNYFREIFESYHPDQIVGVIIEGLPANSGVLVPPTGYLQGLKKICEENGLLLLVDEVFSGFGKTGKFLSVENWDIVPDIVCLGKSMGGGLPISAVATSADIIDKSGSIARGTVGSFSGQIIGCVAAIATMEIIQEEKLLERSQKIGNTIKKRFIELSEQHEIIGDIRGVGSMIGIELVKDRKTKAPANEYVSKVVEHAYRSGLLIGGYGRYGNRNVIRLTPHLVTTDEQVEIALEILEDSLKSLNQ
jgi:4-aminobutyrate aminotransferase/(S)-3-amino-2-methylpropionate transaminase